MGVSSSEHIEWDAETIEKLRRLWSEGYSTAEIGRRMGTSKNAIVGKARRIGLPKRKSPINYNSDPNHVPRRLRRLRVATLPQLDSLSTPAPVPLIADKPEKEPAREKRKDKLSPHLGRILAAPLVFGRPGASDTSQADSIPSRIPSRPRTGLGSAIKPCCWPIGEPRTKAFRFCDADTLPGRSFCKEHCLIAYVGFHAPEAPESSVGDFDHVDHTEERQHVFD